VTGARNPLLIFGAGGQVGLALQCRASAGNVPILVLSRTQADVSDQTELRRACVSGIVDEVASYIGFRTSVQPTGTVEEVSQAARPVSSSLSSTLIASLHVEIRGWRVALPEVVRGYFKNAAVVEDKASEEFV